MTHQPPRFFEGSRAPRPGSGERTPGVNALAGRERGPLELLRRRGSENLVALLDHHQSVLDDHEFHPLRVPLPLNRSGMVWPLDVEGDRLTMPSSGERPGIQKARVNPPRSRLQFCPEIYSNHTFSSECGGRRKDRGCQAAARSIVSCRPRSWSCAGRRESYRFSYNVWNPKSVNAPARDTPGPTVAIWRRSSVIA